MNPKITKLNFTYKKPDSDVWVLNLNDIPINKDRIKDQQIVHFAPKSFGGNHQHPRTEWFIGIGELQLIWLDETGEKYFEQMNPGGEILLIEIPPYTPHAVLNQSETQSAVLFELADGKMIDKEEVQIV